MYADIRKKRVSKIAHGIQGIIYKTQSPSSDNKYAIKRNKTDDDISFIGCLKEIDFLYKLNCHPNIISLMGYYFCDDVFSNSQFSPLHDKTNEGRRNDNVHFLIEYMEYNLEEFVKISKYRNASVFVSIMVDILLGIDYMHKQKIIHRDIKPRNILVSVENNGIVKCKLCDFGLSSIITSQEKCTPDVITPSYKPPEILLRLDYDNKIDIWCTGLVFIEMFSKTPVIKCRDCDEIKILCSVLSSLPNSPPISELEKYLDEEDFKYVRKNTYKVTTGIINTLKIGTDEKKRFSKEINFKALSDLLNGMLSFHPKSRFNIDECLQHEIFDEYGEKIIKIKNHTYCTINHNPTIIFVDCIEREWFFNLILSLFNKRDDLGDCIEWYSHRILFHALEMFDRYIHKKYNSSQRPIHKKLEVVSRFYVILYINVKYFKSFYKFPAFYDFVGDERVKKNGYLFFAEDFERTMIYDVLGYDIYHQTLYEAADDFNIKLDDNDVKNLLLIYGKCKSINGLKLLDVIKTYINNRNIPNIENLKF